MKIFQFSDVSFPLYIIIVLVIWGLCNSSELPRQLQYGKQYKCEIYKLK